MLARLPFFILLSGTSGGLAWLLAQALAEGGWTPLKTLVLLAFLPVGLWLGVCVGNAVPGFVVLMTARRPARAVLPVEGDIETGAIRLRTAVAVAVRNEDMAEVLPPLQRLLAELGEPAHFVGWILSDTQDPALAAAEAEAVARAEAALRYRRRAESNTSSLPTMAPLWVCAAALPAGLRPAGFVSMTAASTAAGVSSAGSAMFCRT